MLPYIALYKVKKSKSNEYSISQINTIGTRGYESINSVVKNQIQEYNSNFLMRKSILVDNIIANQIQVDKVNKSTTILT
jgi:cobalamin biosynthesis protein CbiD